MSNTEKLSNEDTNVMEVPTGPGFKAQLKIYDCQGTGECIKACPEQAIEAGPERLPAAVCRVDATSEMLPGRAEILEDKCTGCGECVSACPQNAIEMVPVAA